MITRDRREELPADKIAAKNEEKIYSDPAEAVDLAGQREPHDAGVVNRDDEDSHRPEEIEAWLARAIRETRINGGIGRGLVNRSILAELRAKKRPAADR